MAQPKHKSMRNQPELYDELKKNVTFCLTQTAIKQLDLLAKAQGISRSEVVEQFARKQLNLPS